MSHRMLYRVFYKMFHIRPCGGLPGRQVQLARRLENGLIEVFTLSSRLEDDP